MGRTNKLVDGCYSFWQGGLFPLLHSLSADLLSQMGVPASAPATAANDARGEPNRDSEPVSGAVEGEAREANDQRIVVPSFPLGLASGLEQQAAAAVDRAQARVLLLLPGSLQLSALPIFAEP